MLTKKDFVGLAEIMRTARNRAQYYKASRNDDILDMIEADLVGFCAGQNPNFNREKFLKACKGD